MARKTTAYGETGEILSLRNKDKCTNYNDFLVKLQKYKDTEDQILKDVCQIVPGITVQEMYDELVMNFRNRNSLIRKSILDLEEMIEKLSTGSSQPTSYQTKLNKLQIDNLKTFKSLLQQELKREKLSKQEALKKFMTQWVNNELAVETP